MKIGFYDSELITHKYDYKMGLRRSRHKLVVLLSPYLTCWTCCTCCYADVIDVGFICTPEEVLPSWSINEYHVYWSNHWPSFGIFNIDRAEHVDHYHDTRKVAEPKAGQGDVFLLRTTFFLCISIFRLSTGLEGHDETTKLEVTQRFKITTYSQVKRSRSL